MTTPTFNLFRGYLSKTDSSPAVILMDQRSGKFTTIPLEEATSLADALVDLAEAIERDSGEHGYPVGVPIHRMTSAEQVAYWKRQARKHENRAKSCERQNQS